MARADPAPRGLPPRSSLLQRSDLYLPALRRVPPRKTVGEATIGMSGQAGGARSMAKSPTLPRSSSKGGKPEMPPSSQGARTPTPVHGPNARDCAPMMEWRRRESSCRERRERRPHRGIRVPSETERSSSTPLWRRTRTATAGTAVKERGRHPLGGTGAASATQGLGGITSVAGLETKRSGGTQCRGWRSMRKHFLSPFVPTHSFLCANAQ